MIHGPRINGDKSHEKTEQRHWAQELHGRVFLFIIKAGLIRNSAIFFTGGFVCKPLGSAVESSDRQHGSQLCIGHLSGGTKGAIGIAGNNTLCEGIVYVFRCPVIVCQISDCSRPGLVPGSFFKAISPPVEVLKVADRFPGKKPLP